jgi:hypothetical protein
MAAFLVPPAGRSLGRLVSKAGNIQGTFRQHSGNIQGTFREHLGNIQGTFREPGPPAEQSSVADGLAVSPNFPD